MKVQVSSIWKEKKMIQKTEGFASTTQLVQYTTLTTKTTEDLLNGGEII